MSWYAWVIGASFAGALSAVLWISIESVQQGVPVVLFLGASVVGGLLWFGMRPLVRAAQWVRLDAEGIKARTFLGRLVRVRWCDIDALRTFENATWQGPQQHLVIVYAGGRRTLTISHLMEQFGELDQHIRTEVAAAQACRKR